MIARCIAMANWLGEEQLALVESNRSLISLIYFRCSELGTQHSRSYSIARRGSGNFHYPTGIKEKLSFAPHHSSQCTSLLPRLYHSNLNPPHSPRFPLPSRPTSSSLPPPIQNTQHSPSQTHPQIHPPPTKLNFHSLSLFSIPKPLRRKKELQNRRVLKRDHSLTQHIHPILRPSKHNPPLLQVTQNSKSTPTPYNPKTSRLMALISINWLMKSSIYLLCVDWLIIGYILRRGFGG